MDQYRKKFKTYVERIVDALPAKGGKELAYLTRQFFDKMPVLELEVINPKDAAAAVAASRDFIAERKAGVPKIRIFSPTLKKDGWETDRTVIQILTDDMPFLVDSISTELARHELNVYQLVHPILRVKRDAKGKLVSIPDPASAKGKDETHESFMHIETSTPPESLSHKQLIADLTGVLAAVAVVVADWKPIMAKVEENIAIVQNAPKKFKKEDVQEVTDFIRWLASNNFIFMGYVSYDFGTQKKASFQAVKGSEKGLFKLTDSDLRPKGLSALPPEVQHFLKTPNLIEITKANTKSKVHRPVYLDYISVKRFDDKGEVIGENRFLGMFTSRVYYQSIEDIPIVRRKVERTLEHANFEPASHNGKAFKAIMEFFPRDELFQTSESDLFDTGMGVLSLDARPAVRLFPRKDLFERFVSCLLYVPRERFSTYLREKVQDILEAAYNGKVTQYYTQVTDSPLARVHLIITTNPGHVPEVDIAKIEDTIAKVTNLWSDALGEDLVRKYGNKRGDSLFRTYKNAFPASYVSQYGSDSAVFDIEKMEQARASNGLALDLFRKKQDDANHIRLKLYNPTTQVPLSDVLPMLENMGFRVLDETPYPITLADDANTTIWERDLRLTMAGVETLDEQAVKPIFEEALAKVWDGSVENDGFNSLVLKAGLQWREVVLLRAYSKYLKQTGLTYNQDFLVNALTNHSAVARMLVDLFDTRFNPAGKAADRAKKSETIAKAIAAHLEKVSNLAEDRVIRLFQNAIESTLRTNFYQKDANGGTKDYISFKFDSRALLELPLPRPFREIFVYSIRIEGIHLRGGKVARGGLRWSDRPEDFRTEVLGLVKAQQVKNAIIVPLGSKGGFVLKQAPTADKGREAFMAEGVACYKTFLRGLLDVTDNIVAGKIIPPKNVVRHDEDDPYLVVAADKGTATFSDYANSISLEYGFWLGDAFASGGSAGYDHKKMGITARGGWVSVMRHFSEMGKDITKEDFTCVGIGDLAGDVFGNGALLSKHMKLVAAFNHMHIFLDPEPDAAKSYKERERMFNLPRSSWTDYDAKLISKGGGIYARSEKSIPISKEVRNVLGLDATVTSLAPDALIKAILKAPVDLLWNGGIGTYVKAKTESHEDVGDRANNPLRINGEDLRCKIVGEGGNLGFTQRGRIEYARKGGRINTDALDNSAGVSCSDHEVNIKIALTAAIENGSLKRDKRDKFLAGMTDNVAELVLRDNQLQNQALSNAEAQGHKILESRARVIRAMEKSGLLNREIEFLPSEEELADRRTKKIGFTRPELAVILAYSKLDLYEKLLHSTVPDDPYYEKDLLEYFPRDMQKHYAKEICAHPLRREIIATVLTNSFINRVGSGFFQVVSEDNGVPACDVARSLTIARDAFQLDKLWEDIEGLTGKVKPELQANMFVEINAFVGRITSWFLRNYPQPIDISSAMASFAPGIREFASLSDKIVSENARKVVERKYHAFLEAGVPQALAKRVADLAVLSSACDVVRVSLNIKLPIKAVGQIYFEIGQRLRLGWLRDVASRAGADSYWDRVATASLVNDLFDQQRRLTLQVIGGMTKKDDAEKAIEKWLDKNASPVERFNQFVNDLAGIENVDFAMLIIAMRNLDHIFSATIAEHAA